MTDLQKAWALVWDILILMMVLTVIGFTVYGLLFK